MANTNTLIQIKHSTTSGNVPATLANGELAINTADAILYFQDPQGNKKKFTIGPVIDEGFPANPYHRQLFWSAEEGALKIYYIDGDGTGQWVDTNGGSNILDIPIYDQSLNTTNNVSFANVSTSALIFSDGTTQNTAYNRTDKFESKSAATGVVTHDCSNVSVFYHTSISDNFTINITNLPVSVNSAAAVTLVLSQGATAYVCNAVQIGAVSQAVLWQGSTSAPTGNANKTDLMTFSIMRTGASSYIVFGQLVSFG